MNTSDCHSNTIIAFEGLDCSFKETNYKAFLNKLRTSSAINNNFNKFNEVSIHAESFPRYSHWTGKLAAKWLDGSFDREMLKEHPVALKSLYSIDRMEYWYGINGQGKKRIDLLNDNFKTRYFVFDRYSLSNTIYNPIHPDTIDIEDFDFDRKVYGVPNPNVIIWMRMKNFDKLLSLLAQKENKDKNELDIEFLRKIWERSENIIQNGNEVLHNIGSKLVVVDCLDEYDNIRCRESIESFVWKSALQTNIINQG